MVLNARMSSGTNEFIRAWVRIERRKEPDLSLVHSHIEGIEIQEETDLSKNIKTSQQVREKQKKKG